MLAFPRASWCLAVSLIIICVATAAPAGASWQATIERDDFGSDHVGTAATTAEGKVFGLRCQNGQEPALVFATLELWADQLAELPATLLIKVDDGEPQSQQAVLEQYPRMMGLTQQLGVRVLASGNDLFPILDAIAKAKNRITVAVELAGQRFENTRFSARGSRASFKRIWQFCGSSLDNYTKPEL